MPRGKDTSRDPKRRVDNVVFGNFGHPMQNHPAFLASRGMLPQADKSKKVRTELASSTPTSTEHMKQAITGLAQVTPEEVGSYLKSPNVRPNATSLHDVRNLDNAPVYGIPRPPQYTEYTKQTDDAPVKGIPRPKLTKKEMED